jgi:hypothetical protein
MSIDISFKCTKFQNATIVLTLFEIDGCNVIGDILPISFVIFTVSHAKLPISETKDNIDVPIVERYHSPP